MSANTQQVVPVTMALLLHVVIFSSLIIVIDFSGPPTPAVPLAITASLVTELPEPAPPQVEEPPPPEPDTTEQDRIRAEEQKRLEDARRERERLEAMQKAEQEARLERQRLADAERLRKEDEARKEAARIKAEQDRQAEIERQRRENERLRAEADAARQAELDAESNRIAAMQADAKSAYVYKIQQRIANRWVRPPTATAGIECIVNIRQLPGGEVVSVNIGRCNGDATVRRSIENAVHQASPLPLPDDPSVFDRNIQLEFRPRDD